MKNNQTDLSSNSIYSEQIPFDKEPKLFQMIGDCMDNGTSESICDKDIIKAIEINKDDLCPIEHQPYILVTNNSNNEIGVCVCRIAEHSTVKKHFVCQSLNPNKSRNPDFQIEIKDVERIFKVVEVQRNR